VRDAFASESAPIARSCSRQARQTRGKLLGAPIAVTLRVVDDPAHILDKVIGDRYRVVSAIATGSIGAVYEAEDRRGGAHVAVKVLQPETAKRPEVAARFEREAKTMSLLEHPNIVRLLDHGRLDDGKCFLVFELVRGVSLRALLDDGIVESKRALAIVRQLLEALQHAHDHGVIHRDVKPENLMLVDGGAPDRDADFVKVLDFGVAKLVDDTLAVLGESTLTQTGCNVFGTPLYLAPEMALGRVADHRADIYSTGVVLFELLAGRPPCTADDPLAVLRQHASSKMPTLAEAAPDRSFTPALEYLVAEALAKQPTHRFATARDMIGALDQVASTLDPVATIEALREEAPSMPAPGMPAVVLPALVFPAPAPPPPAMSAAKMPVPVMPVAAGAEPLRTLPQAPRFGVTPVRDARQRRLWAGIAAAVVLVVIIAIAASRKGGGAGKPGVSQAQTPAIERSDLARRALDLLARGSAADANDLLERETATEPGRSDARAFVALGRARLAQHRRSDAIAAYERAIALGREIARDTQIKLDVVKILDTRDTVAAVIAIDFLATKVEPPAREAIVAEASNGKLADVRHRALAVAQRDGFADGVDRVESWSLDLEQATTCDDRRAALIKLRGTGDRRALAVLRRVRGRYACIDRDIDSAISQLEAQP
jgi:serine/threonine protein kinase